MERTQERILPMNKNHTIVYFTCINSILWSVVHISISYVITRLPVSVFAPDFWLFRIRTWERSGAFYNLFYIRKWKRLLPDGAVLLAGVFPKKRLIRKDPEYLHRFISETCRAETVHWFSLIFVPVFLVWNTSTGTVVNGIYAVFANIPCIVTQRFNRSHLQSLLQSIKRKSLKHLHK